MTKQISDDFDKAYIYKKKSPYQLLLWKLANELLKVNHDVF